MVVVPTCSPPVVAPHTTSKETATVSPAATGTVRRVPASTEQLGARPPRSLNPGCGPLHHREAVAAVRVDGHRLQPIEAQREAVRVGLGSGRGSRGHDLARSRSTRGPHRRTPAVPARQRTKRPGTCDRTPWKSPQRGNADGSSSRRRGARPRPALESYVDAPASVQLDPDLQRAALDGQQVGQRTVAMPPELERHPEPPTARPLTVSSSRKSGSTGLRTWSTRAGASG